MEKSAKTVNWNFIEIVSVYKIVLMIEYMMIYSERKPNAKKYF